CDAAVGLCPAAVHARATVLAERVVHVAVLAGKDFAEHNRVRRTIGNHGQANQGSAAREQATRLRGVNSVTIVRARFIAPAGRLRVAVAIRAIGTLGGAAGAGSTLWTDAGAIAGHGRILVELVARTAKAANQDR